MEFAEPDYRVRVYWRPDDSLLPVQWHHTPIQSQWAWNSSIGLPQIKVRYAAWGGWGAGLCVCARRTCWRRPPQLLLRPDPPPCLERPL